MPERIYQTAMDVPAVLIRVMSKRNDHTKWLKPEQAITDLVKDPFGYAGEPISVYRVMVGSEETRAVAAHYLTLNRSYYDTVWALRIESQDVDHIGMSIRETPGNTGIADIDAKHRDIIGDQRAFELLTEHLYDRIHHGEDRLRVVGTIQLVHQIQGFLNAASDIVSEEARARCLRLAHPDGP
jgi:hypothetical protein